MLKKITTLLAAAAFMAVTAGHALAFFDDQSLIRVVYDASSATGREVAYDLGNINTILAGGNSTLSTTNTIATDFSGIALGNLRVTYFAYDSTKNNGSIYSTGGATAPTANLTTYDTAMGAIFMSALNVWQTSGTNQSVSTNANANSYYNLFTLQGNANGTLAQSFPTNGTSEASLATLASGVPQKLYFFADANAGGKGTLALSLTTNADGTITVNSATPTPIPPSMLLMGSGLLGMIGIRRKLTV